jgi:signal transduction histidine kinase
MAPNNLSGTFKSTTIQWVAAIAAFLSAIVVAITTASNWKQKSAEHTTDKLLWAAVDSDIEEIRFHSNGELDDKAVDNLVKDRDTALKTEHNLTPSELRRARQWLAGNRPDVVHG